MKDVIFDDFQNSVDESLLRHKSILDVITKFQESQSRISRALSKSVTGCGCIKINATKQKLPEECEDIGNLTSCFKTHIEGELCDNCRGIIESEIGSNLFYLTSLCNVLGINLYDVLLKEYEKINTLGKYTLR